MLNGSLPTFSLQGGQWLVIVARALTVASLLAGFGTLALRATIARRLLARTEEGERATRRLAWGSIGLFTGGLCAWTAAQAALLADAASTGEVLTTVAQVIKSTAFGHLVLAQAGAVTLGAIAFGAGWAWLSVLAVGFAVALQSGHLHAWAMQPGPSVLLVSEALHLLAAAVWLGALPALALLIRCIPPDDAIALSRQFSALGAVAVLLIAGTAAWQGWTLSGGLTGLAGTAYGWMELVKLGLFVLLLGCAAANRWRFTPKLAGTEAGQAKRALTRSIVIETALGLSVIFAAAVLTSLEPGMHTQPVWPFSEQPSLVIVREDPVFRQEVENAVGAMLGAIALVGLGTVVRWLRWVAWPVALAIAWFAVPHFDLLFVEAYPTSFYHSPTEFAATSIVEGAALFPSHCASCHGAEGRGEGPAAKGLKVPPADLTAGHLWAHSDGEMFWWLTHGIVSPEGEVAMPPFGDDLSEQERWALIDYVRANNAGLTRRATRAWSPPVQAPALGASCADGRAVTLADLRGRVVRLAFGTALGDGEGAVTIAVPLGSGERTQANCVADDPAVPSAYAIVAGLDQSALQGTQILVDANGWLREVLPPGEADTLHAAIGSIAAEPLGADAVALGHHMPM